MRLLIRLAAAMVALAGSAAAFAGLPGSISGTWYNPAQSGHGLSLDVLAADRAVAIWHVFDAQGQPLTLYIEAQIDGRQLSGQAYAPRGMRFGSFNPAQLQLPVWGQVEIEFASCDRAELSWRSTQAGFSDGRMPLVRLAQVNGRSCTLPPENALAAGLYLGELDGSANFPRTPVEGIVDREGRLWGFQRELSIPGTSWVGSHVPRVFRIEPITSSNSEVRASGTLFMALAFWRPSGEPANTSGSWRIGAGGAAVGEFTTSTPVLGTHRWRPGAPAGSTLVAPLSIAELQGEYNLELKFQFFAYQTKVRIAADGSICTTYSIAADSVCQMLGQVSTPEGRFGLIDFVLADQLQPELARYRGRGWLLDTPTGRELILVGDNGTVGLLVTADAR